MAEYIKDDGAIKAIADKVIKESFPKFSNIKIAYQFIDKARNSKGRTIYAEANKIPGKLDNYIDYDLIITVAEDKWAAAEHQKTREAIIDDVLRTIHLEGKEGTEVFPRRLADDYYQLSNGKKVKGLKEAGEAQAKICDYDIKIYDYDIQANSKNFEKYGAWREDLAAMKQTVMQPGLPKMRVVND
ncbi:hypothetical protein SAMN06265827_105101 [Orenia metallireducens]|uniref:Putative phage metallopeptidase domain-containing protein n=1 Tax=Orenia metallireducens TaxID=1413210 RepID=A0A285G704_9FIRM|nr:putative metallopeptidase [Orenia metallireducens]SNY19327.1 hypothetical protein SAMN06265827_105101 [Orenia metallireducens]